LAPTEASRAFDLDPRELDFLRSRIATFGKVGAAMAVFSTVAQLGVAATVDGYAEPFGPAFFLVAAAILPPTSMWLYARREGRSRRALEVFDALLPIAGAALYSGCLAFLSPQHHFERLALLALTFLAVFRAALIPSTLKRTVAITAAMAVPLTAATAYAYKRYVPPPGDVLGAAETPLAMSLWTLLWWSATLLLCAVVTRVVYGLRVEIRRAQQMGQYTLGEKLGSGGMGTVYRASHALLRRPTAVKVLRANADDTLAMARFEREVQLTAMLTHPNTVTVFDFGHTTDGHFYYAMELLDGASLAEVGQATGPQPPGRVVEVIRMVADALEEAHGIGLTHRDIKPANIILARLGGRCDVAKVLDFGLVKLVSNVRGPDSSRTIEATKHAISDGNAEITRASDVTGTPLYMAPEAIIAPDTVGPATDIYSLGAVAYYLLTGTHVFQGPSTAAVLERHLHEQPEPPSERLGRALPPELEALVLQCLEKTPSDRPPSAAAVRDRVVACPNIEPWTEERARAWWEENKRAIVAVHRDASSDSELPTMGIDLSGRARMLSTLTLPDVSRASVAIPSAKDHLG
jgi:eukaryotic-like serine/threonine-protein kinase